MDTLYIIPSDPHFMPTVQASARTSRAPAAMLVAHQEIEPRFDDEVGFIGGPDAFSNVACPCCSAAMAGEWLSERVSSIYDANRFSELRVTAPCCEASVTLNAFEPLRFRGFAKYSIAAWYPEVRDRPEDSDLRPWQLSAAARGSARLRGAGAGDPAVARSGATAPPGQPAAASAASRRSFVRSL